MAARKKKTVSKAGSSKNLPAVPWKQALANKAKAGKVAKEKPATGDFISIKGNKFSLGGVVLGRELDCVIVSWCYDNSYFDADYKEGESQSPACFAIGFDEDALAPHSTAPNKQSSTCEDCWCNEWGSGKGDGKACGNRRRLALVVEGKDGKPDMKMLRIAPTSLKNWKEFMNDIENMGLETMQCAVNIHFDEDSTAQAHPLIFDFVSEITNEKQLDILAGTLEQAEKMLEQPYDVSNYGKPAKPKRAGKKTAKKKTVAKKKGRSKFS